LWFVAGFRLVVGFGLRLIGLGGFWRTFGMVDLLPLRDAGAELQHVLVVGVPPTHHRRSIGIEGHRIHWHWRRQLGERDAPVSNQGASR
jgi:hypothetical protein